MWYHSYISTDLGLKDVDKAPFELTETGYAPFSIATALINNIVAVDGENSRSKSESPLFKNQAKRP